MNVPPVAESNVPPLLPVPAWSDKSFGMVEKVCCVSSNFASADFRKIKTYNFQKSESYSFQKLRNLQI